MKIIGASFGGLRRQWVDYHSESSHPVSWATGLTIGYGNFFLSWISSMPPTQWGWLICPESVWAQGSSNSGGLSLIFSSSHLLTSLLLIFTFSSSHLLIFTSSHLYIFSLHIFSSSHSHLHIFSSSHLLTSLLLIFTFSSSHLFIFTSSHLHIFSSSHLRIFSSSHLLIFTTAHLHIFSSSHLHIFTSSHLHGLEHCFSIQLGILIIPTDFHIFFRGVETTNQ